MLPTSSTERIKVFHVITNSERVQKPFQMLNVTTRFCIPSSQSKMVRETKTAVKRFANRPITRVTANPFTGPVPNRNRNAQLTIVVTCVSTIVTSAPLIPKPFSIAAAAEVAAYESEGLIGLHAEVVESDLGDPAVVEDLFIRVDQQRVALTDRRVQLEERIRHIQEVVLHQYATGAASVNDWLT